MKVSAYIPCYNAQTTIRETIRSIAAQTITPAEIFVVDDGSTDGSTDAVGVKVIRLNCNAGRGAARARAMSEAQHELVLGCDATMQLDRHFLKSALAWFSNDKVAAVFGWINEAAEPTVANRWRGRHLFQSQIKHEVTRHGSLATHCSMIRKSAAEQVGGFNPSLKAGEDADLGQRLLGAGFDVVFDPKLFGTSALSNSVIGVLERYTRWNTLSRMSIRGYLRQINYSLKVMVPKDLIAKDPLGAFISLLAPHYQFWGSGFTAGTISVPNGESPRLFWAFSAGLLSGSVAVSSLIKMKFLRSVGKKVIDHERRKQLHRIIRRWRHFGLARYCPCCKAHLRRFIPVRLDPSPEAGCPVCGSMQRHRLIWLYMERNTDLFDGNHKRMLHVAPEPELARLFRKPDYIEYLSADLFASNAMVKMDITDIQYSANSFDVIYCSHVLEHVPDDNKAMREFHRVLKPGGWAILQVPITADSTFEDETANSDERRVQLFGQHDHVRRYGPDYKDRLADSGFTVTVNGFARELDDRATSRFGLTREEDVYFCRKQAK
jgi:glycosyltransferase involved in cell wall biosynthesis/SAM-dependent methyltransferase